MKLLHRDAQVQAELPDLSELTPLQLLSLLHSAPTEQLGQLLRALLAAQDHSLPSLMVVVPELCLQLSQLILAQDAQGSLALCRALDSALSSFDCQAESPGFVGAHLPPEQGRQLAWLLGRLESTLIFARRTQLLKLPPSLQEELMDGGRSRGLLKLLSEHGAMNLRAIAHLKALDGDDDTPERVRTIMSPLVKAGMVELVQRAGRNEYRLSPLGTRVMEDRPVWLDAVERAYRAFRQGHEGLPVAFLQDLTHIFQSVDASLDPNAVAPSPPQGVEPPPPPRATRRRARPSSPGGEPSPPET